MKSVMIAAALCAAFCLSSPAAHAATVAKGPTDMQIYCGLAPWAAKCKAPAKAMPKITVHHRVAHVASITKPVLKSHRNYSCVKAAANAGHLYDCTWK